MTLVTSSNWINCHFSRPSKVRMSFCQISAVLVLQIFKICQTVARQKYDQSISQKNFCCLSLTNYFMSKLWLPYIGVIFAIVCIITHWQDFEICLFLGPQKWSTWSISKCMFLNYVSYQIRFVPWHLAITFFLNFFTYLLHNLNYIY